MNEASQRIASRLRETADVIGGEADPASCLDAVNKALAAGVREARQALPDYTLPIAAGLVATDTGPKVYIHAFTGEQKVEAAVAEAKPGLSTEALQRAVRDKADSVIKTILGWVE